MCCKEDRKLFKKKSKSLRCHNKKKSEGKKVEAGLVPKGNGTRTAEGKRQQPCKPHGNANGAAAVVHSPDHSRRRIFKQKRAIIDSPVTRRLLPEAEKLGQTELDALTLDILVQVICKLKDDDLKPLFHVSKKFREAVLIARQIHFAFLTPTRPRRRSRFYIMNSDTDCWSGRPWPPTPKAPRAPKGKSLKTLLPEESMHDITVALFSSFEDDETDSVSPRALVRAGSSNRIQFCEDELCKAVSLQTL